MAYYRHPPKGPETLWDPPGWSERPGVAQPGSTVQGSQLNNPILDTVCFLTKLRGASFFCGAGGEKKWLGMGLTGTPTTPTP